MNGEPSGPRATAALIVTLVLLIGGFSIIFLLLLRPIPVGALDAQTTLAVVGGIGGTFAAISLAMRYWFPPTPRNPRRDDGKEN